MSEPTDVLDGVHGAADETAKSLPANSTMTRKRYQEMERGFAAVVLDATMEPGLRVDALMRVVRDVMKFDPDAKRYTPELGKKILAYRQRKAASAGVSMYELFKGHEYYDKNKETLNKKNAEYKRKKQNAAANQLSSDIK